MIKFKKLTIALVALLSMSTTAWAENSEKLLVTINASDDFCQGSQTFNDIVTATFSGQVFYSLENTAWISGSLWGKTLTIQATEGYAITRVRFITTNGSADDTTAPFEAELRERILETNNYASCEGVYVNNTLVSAGTQDDGLTRIEVYGHQKHNLIVEPADEFSKGKVEVTAGTETLPLDDNGKVNTAIAPATKVKVAAKHGYVLEKVEAKEIVPVTLATALKNGATMVIAYTWTVKTTVFTFTNDNGTYLCNISGEGEEDFTGSLTLNGSTLSLSITNSEVSDLKLEIDFDTMYDSFRFVSKSSFWYNAHTVSINGTDITSQLTEEN